MNVTANSQRLAVELRLLCKIVPTKPVIAILSHVLLRANGTGLHLHATDLEVSLTTNCEAHVEMPGTIALPAARLLAMVEQFADTDVSITLDATRATVQCGAFRSKLQVMPVADFPELPTIEGAASTIDAGALRWLIARTRYAVAATSSRYILQGALLTLTGPAAAMVATDSKRLALAMIAREGADQRVTIPAKTLDVLAGQLGDGGNVEMTIGSRHIFFMVDGRLLTSRTIDGEFPKYERIIPRDNNKVIIVERNQLAAALRRVALTAEENYAVHFDVAQGSMGLSSASAGIGSAEEVVEINYDGTPLRVCANGGYVLDFLEAASGQEVTISLKDVSSPMLLADGSDYVAVIMLMRGGSS